MSAGRTTYVVILGMLLASAGCGFFSGKGNGLKGGGKAPSHKLTSILIDSECQLTKEDLVKVKSNASRKGKVDWLVSVASECTSYNNGDVVKIQFVDGNGNDQNPPGSCNNPAFCSDKLNGSGSAKITLDVDPVTSPVGKPFVVYIGSTKLDPRLEIDP